MDNYYETCLQTIKQLIDEGNVEDANKILEKELSMPYVPEPYYTSFLDLHASIDVTHHAVGRALSFDEIVACLHDNEDNKMRALTALESMNLHRYRDALKSLLQTDDLTDSVKKHILMCCKEQNIDMTVSMVLNQKQVELSIAAIEDPFCTEAYASLIAALQQAFETDNPSMYLISVEYLNGLVYEAFPYWDESINAQVIIQQVQALFGETDFRNQDKD